MAGVVHAGRPVHAHDVFTRATPGGGGWYPRSGSCAVGVTPGLGMPAWLEDAGESRYRGVYGDPNGFGTEVCFDSLDEALAWANTDGSAAFLIVTDE